MSRTLARAAAVGFLFASLLTAPVAAQDAAPSGWAWQNSTEFAFVTAAGNSSSTTLGLKGRLVGETEVEEFKFELGGIRASSQFTDRTATETGGGGYTLNETVREEKSAENYYVRARYDRDLGENNFFLHGGAGWQRNTFAGFKDRYSFVLGFGDTWIDDDVTMLKADIGGTYTIQKDVEPVPEDDEGFGGLRANVEFRRALTGTTDFETLVVADENLSDTDDFRLDWTAAVSVSITDGLALKTSYQVLFDNKPARIAVPLYDAGGTALGTNVTILSEKVDSFMTLSLVISL